LIGRWTKLNLSIKVGMDCGILAIQLEAGTTTKYPTAHTTVKTAKIKTSAAMTRGMRSLRFIN
jgi:hypothetical protein